MKSTPIILQTPLVEQILAGVKRQTRRPVKGEALELLRAGFTPDYVADRGNHLCRYGYPGDELWIREKWARLQGEVNGEPVGPVVLYAAGPSTVGERVRWRSPLHLKKTDARLFLEITGTRIERLQEIDEGGAFLEGFQPKPELGAMCDKARGTFRVYWDSMYRSKPEFQWHSDPWVWVITFEVRS